MRLLCALTFGVALANGCVLDRMRIDPGLDAAGEMGEGGAAGSAGATSGGGGATAGMAGDGGARVGDGGAEAGATPNGQFPGGNGPTAALGGAGAGGTEVAALAGQAGLATNGGESGASSAGGVSAGGEGGGPSSDCGYTESSDSTNDYRFGTPEETGLTMAGAVTICGRTEINHFSASDEVIDIDSYYIDAPQPTEVMVTLVYEGDPDYVAELEIDGQGEDAVRRHTSMATHASFSLKLGAGRTRLAVRAEFPYQPTMKVSYQLRVHPDNLEQRCPRATAATAFAVYTEDGDGPNSTGNDYYRVNRYTEAYESTLSSSDVPETFISVDGLQVGKQYLISGIAGVTTASDDYADGDFYKLNTFDADQMTVRLDWDDSTADLDLYFLGFSEIAAAASKHAKTSGPEAFTLSVFNPNYVELWVGGVATGSQYPQPYTLTICPSIFKP